MYIKRFTWFTKTLNDYLSSWLIIEYSVDYSSQLLSDRWRVTGSQQESGAHLSAPTIAPLLLCCLLRCVPSCSRAPVCVMWVNERARKTMQALFSTFAFSFPVILPSWRSLARLYFFSFNLFAVQTHRGLVYLVVFYSTLWQQTLRLLEINSFLQGDNCVKFIFE